MRPSSSHWLIATFFLLFSLGARDALAAPRPSAQAFESRLYAPCCYNGTLDIHESEMARDLRKEIETRIDRGESVDAIQEDFVARYGDKVLAARSDKPSQVVGVVLAALIALSAAGLVIVFRRWKRPTVKREPPTARDDLDRQIDADLAELDLH